MIRQLFRVLYATAHHYITQIPDLHTYVQNRERLASGDVEDVIVKLANAEDFQQLAATVDKFRTSTRIIDRTGRGDVCVVAYKHGALAHVRWAALTPVPAWGNDTVHLAPDEAFFYDVYTLPAFRRQGISSEARSFLCAYLAQQGIRCSYATNRIDNILIQPDLIKRVREGRVRILGQIAITTRFGRTRCTYSAETATTRPLIARLFQVSLRTVRIRKSVV